MSYCSSSKDSSFSPRPIPQVADMPYPLYLSLQGKYFVGYADDMSFGNNTIAWAGLINPIHSRVNLHLYVWTVTNTGTSPLIAKVWFNTYVPGQPIESEFVTPANTALRPLPKPRVKLLQANNAAGTPLINDSILESKVLPEVTLASDEQGKYIFGPGGSFIITLSVQDASSQTGAGRVAFGWAEEKISNHKIGGHYDENL